MKTITLQQLSLLSLSAVALATSTLTAQAQTSPTTISSDTTEVLAQESQAQATAVPVPGTVTTSAAGLEFQSAASSPNPVPQASEDAAADTDVAQGPFGVARPTRSGQSYIGVGYNIGLGGDDSVGDAAFAINGKIGLTNTLSVRPAAILGDETAFLIPVTYDFNVRRRQTFDAPITFAPYAGGGLLFSTADDEDLGFLLTGGIDVPFSQTFTANAGINVGFTEDDTEVGLLLGVGYTFPGF